MKKILLLLILVPLMAISQTIPADATALENIQITNNTTSLTATKVNVQDANGVINTISKSDLVDVVEVNDVPSLPLVGEVGKIYVVKTLNKIYRWNGTFYSELAYTDISGKENISNKQNSLAVDGSGVKFPTVDGVNANVIHKNLDEYKDGFLKLTGFGATLAGNGLELYYDGISNFSGINSLQRDAGLNITTRYPLYFQSQYNIFQYGKVGIYNQQNVEPLAPLHVGDRQVNNSSDAVILVSRNVDSTIGGNGHAFSDSSNFSRNAGNPAYNSFDARTNITGTGSRDHYAAFQVGFTYSNTGTMTDHFGYFSGGDIQAGKIVNFYGGYMANPQKYAGNAIDNLYGLYIANQTAGTLSNWGVYSAGGLNYLAGNTGIGNSNPLYKLDLGSVSSNSLLRVGGLLIGTNSSSYPTVGYNAEPSGANAWKYAGNDNANFIQFSNNIRFFTAPSGTTGATIAPTERMSISTSTGAVLINNLAGSGTRAVVADSNGNLSAVSGVDSRPYKVYTALLSQSGTDAPVATVLENTLGGTVTWSRTSAGKYLGTLTGAFAGDKTISFFQSGSSSAGSTYTYDSYKDSNNSVRLYTLSNGAFIDQIIAGQIEIRVYN